MKPITVGNFDATLEDGKWIYKAKQTEPVSQTSAKYQEKPQFKIQVEIENASKERFFKLINKTVLETVKFLKNNI